MFEAIITLLRNEQVIATAIILLKIAIVFGFVLNVAAVMSWVERKQSAVMQDRIGANRADILGFRMIGLFHILADTIKMLTKEDWIPPKGNPLLHTLAPFLSLFAALIVFAVIPFGDTLHVGSYNIPLQIVDLDVGVLFVLAFGSLGVYSVVLAGWSSDNKYSLLGGVRGAAQVISYELALGLSIIGVVMVFGSIELDDIARAQGGYVLGFIPCWGVVVQPLGFLIFFAAAVAETKRTPFDLPESESEIIGYFTEYSGMKFGAFWMGEFIEIVAVAGVMTALYFGGWQVPFLNDKGLAVAGALAIPLPHLLVVLMQVTAFVIKVLFFCWLMLLIRWTLPRFRYDQLMDFGWKFLLPLALLNVVLTGFLLLAFRG
ncbi:MAG: NADH-quinone oxidoreductase subunit H [Candidatus Brocadiales bacterium]